MRCRSWRILLVVALAVVVAPAVHAQFRDVIPEGFLPLSTIDLKSYYARVVTETLSPDGREVLMSTEGEVYYKRGEAADDPGQWHLFADGERLGTYSAPVPAPPVELFFRNYELRITGIDRILDRTCHVVEVVVRAEERPLFSVCVDQETGVTLRYEQHFPEGIVRERLTHFEPNIDLSQVDLGDPEPQATHTRDITLAELQTIVPWIRLPAGTPEGYELIGIQLMSLKVEEAGDINTAYLYYSDGLERFNLSIVLWPDLVQNPSRALFEETLGPADVVIPKAATLAYKGEDRTKLSLMGFATNLSSTDLAEMLWSMLPEDE